MTRDAFLVCTAPMLACLGLCMLRGSAAAADPSPSERPLAVKSPDGTIELTVGVEDGLTYALSVDGKEVIEESKLGLQFRDDVVLGHSVEVTGTERRTNDTTWENPLGEIREVRDHFNELKVVLTETGDPARTFEVLFRAYDEGVAFRYVLPEQENFGDFVLEKELTTYVFPANHACFLGNHDHSFQGSQEWPFVRSKLSDMKPESVFGSPVLVQTPELHVALTESDLLDWAGLWYAGAANVDADTTGSVTVVSKLAPRPDGQGVVVGSAPRHSPWRVLLIAREPGRLVESELVANLATPCVLEDPSWVKPGMAGWDWWSGASRMNTESMKQYIQFCAEMGWQYMLIDAGWMGGGMGGFGGGGARGRRGGTGGITAVIPALDMEELRRFAEEKDVRLWLWLHWTSVDRNDAYLDGFPVYEEWGIAGVKVDFMDRDDQEMVNWYEKIVKAAAEHHLMVNFHGAFKNCGFQRTYPNQVTREGIMGNEYNRWSRDMTSEHKLTLPFTRLLCGPADYTPGGFKNRQPEKFQTNVRPTQVLGTRCSELALFVVLDNGPVCNACDHYTNYRDQPGLDFLKVVPTVWDEVKVLDAAVAEHIVTARRSGDDWFLGALTDSNARELSVKLDFLGEGTWKMRLWRDAEDSDENGEHLEVEDRSVMSGDSLSVKLAPNGGYVAHLQKE